MWDGPLLYIILHIKISSILCKEEFSFAEKKAAWCGPSQTCPTQLLLLNGGIHECQLVLVDGWCSGAQNLGIGADHPEGHQFLQIPITCGP